MLSDLQGSNLRTKHVRITLKAVHAHSVNNGGQLTLVDAAEEKSYAQGSSQRRTMPPLACLINHKNLEDIYRVRTEAFKLPPSCILGRLKSTIHLVQDR
ncbi:hypothetical protein PAAG_11459 [Paracoccidioides lutzii Pb01]|uniref:Uncharacterized protein n=1 Tax=Paracoccidioides lutzii (strain ATCC MYA-826 / Pb01) TaxID=502779 RepID=A0A0A2V1U6_PARBA|nr:hypothetical protein PAAG_11459 [Paracoccidioides lutzii Pb01]KGQ01741.1 hypothetical protein PAAG_11459 [Paracoccidioides lutzii Pb01]